jgi:hypothetical protein
MPRKLDLFSAAGGQIKTGERGGQSSADRQHPRLRIGSNMPFSW